MCRIGNDYDVERQCLSWGTIKSDMIVKELTWE
jgi:hypothetical protein